MLTLQGPVIILSFTT